MNEFTYLGSVYFVASKNDFKQKLLMLQAKHQRVNEQKNGES